jgi:hypothetical protein
MAAFKGHTGVVDALLKAGSTCDPVSIEEGLKYAADQKRWEDMPSYDSIDSDGMSDIDSYLR